VNAPKPWPRAQRPPRTGYNDSSGVYHPGPTYDGFDEHADACASCAAERADPERSGYVPGKRATEPSWSKDVPLPAPPDGVSRSIARSELAPMRLIAPWWKRLLAFLRATHYPGELDDLRLDNAHLINENRKLKMMVSLLNEENQELYQKLERANEFKAKTYSTGALGKATPIKMPMPGPVVKVSR